MAEYIKLTRRKVYRGDVYNVIEAERIKVLPNVLNSEYMNGVHDGLKKALEVLAEVEDVEDYPAADVVDAGYKAFAEWVARIIFNGGLEDESFCELACRKLNDLGIVEKTENEWHYDDPCKNITPAILWKRGIRRTHTMSEEYIRRKSVTVRLNRRKNQIVETYGENDEYVKCLDDVVNVVDGIPAADVVEVKHGRWVKVHDEVCYWLACSACGEEIPKRFGTDYYTNYCPNCGAKMTEDHHEQKE